MSIIRSRKVKSANTLFDQYPKLFTKSSLIKKPLVIRLDGGTNNVVCEDSVIVYLNEYDNLTGLVYKLGQIHNQNFLGVTFDRVCFDRFRGDINVTTPIIFIFSLKKILSGFGVEILPNDPVTIKYDHILRKGLKNLDSHWTHNHSVKNAKGVEIDFEALNGHSPKLHNELIEAVTSLSGVTIIQCTIPRFVL